MSAAHQSRAPDDVQRIAELEEENTYLKRQLAMEVDQNQLIALRDKFGLTNTQAIVLSALVAAHGRTVEKAALVMLLEERGSKITDFEMIGVLVCHIRKAIGFESIKNVWGRGYRVSPEFLSGLAQ